MASSKKYDIVLFGVTGYTGKWALEHALRTYDNLKFAIAGRSEKKLAKVLEEMKELGLRSDVPTIIADSFNRESLENMCKSTKVVCSTVGPFANYGNLLIEVCVQESTHYCDITGEITWVKSNVDKFHDICVEKQISIVSCCGFDCLPSDITSFLAVQEMKKLDPQGEILTCNNHVMKMVSGASGGTLHTVLNMFEGGISNLITQARFFYLNMFALADNGRWQLDKMFPSYDTDLKSWFMWHPLGPGNVQTVHRSSDLLDYGPNFVCTEDMRIKGMCAIIIGYLLPFILLFIASPMLVFPLTRWYVIPLFIPAPGEGASRELCDRGKLSMKAVCKTKEQTVVCTWNSAGADPGYKGTGLQLVEAGLVLANKKDIVGGVITPAAAFGNDIVERLTEVGYLKVSSESL